MVLTGVRFQLQASASALRAVLVNRDIRRLQIGWMASVAADWAFLVAVLVLAYQVGGALAVGVVGLARMTVATLTAPLAAGLVGRFPPERVLLAINVVRVLVIGAAGGIMAAGGPAAVMLVAVAAEAGAAAAVRPVQNVMLPALARSPDELVASNVASSTGEGIGTFVGPAMGGFAVAWGGPVAASVLVVAMLAVAVLAVAPIRLSGVRITVRSAARTAFWSRLAQGVGALRARPAPRLIVAAFAAQTFVRGLLTVLLVVAAIDLLALGEPGVGLLNSAIGLGGFLGVVLAVALVGQRRLAGAFALALVFWGLPIAVIGAWPAPALAISVLVVLGASNAILDVTGFTLLQRTVPDDARAAVFGLFEGVIGVDVALGSVVAPLLLTVLGTEGAFVATGAILPLTAALAWAGLSKADDAAVAPERELTLLSRIPMFVPLPMTALEQIAGRLTEVHFAAGNLITRQGDPGDRFYLIEDGVVEVVQDGRLIRTCGPRSWIGEIALLRHVPRTATVRATAETTAFALDGPDFIAAVTARPDSLQVAEAIVDEHLGRDREAAIT